LVLNVFIDPEIPPVLIGDAGRLRQIILNIVDNAVKFTAQGDVNVHVKCVNHVDDQVTVAFSIRDTGIGLSPEAQGRLFQPFVQADGSTTRKYGGTGLGLAICKKLVQLMGGEIQLYSRLGEGSMFSFELALTVSDDLDLQNLGYDSKPLSGLNVLIIDDDANACFILEQYLHFWQMNVSSVQDSASALALIHTAESDENAFDIFVVAQHVAGQTAFEIASEIRQIPVAADVPMILHAGYDQSGLKYEALDAGFSSILPKPVNMSHLFDCLAQALQMDAIEASIEMNEDEHVDHDATALFEGVQILLVEDNPVNQKVAQMHLSKLGCVVEVVNNGQEAMHAMMQTDIYDIIFMDCQMPVMDGFKATHNIRAYEIEEGGHRCIVAMTANAMKGDRDVCIEAGMDDYMSKPVSRDRIAEVIRRNLVVEDDGLQLRHSSDDQSSHGEYINLDQLRDLFGDDNEAIAEILQLFQQSMQQVLTAKMPHALQQQDCSAMKALAHELKGAAANIGGDDIAQLCARMEEQIEIEDWQSIASNMQELHDAYGQLDKMCMELGVNE